MKKLTRILGLVFVFQTMLGWTILTNPPKTSAQNTQPFSDVSPYHPNFTAISDLKKRNIINGYPDGTFKPDQFINRVESLKLILLSAKIDIPETNIEKLFTDVQKLEWYSKYLVKAKELNLIKGYPDGSYKPAQFINLVENLKILLLAHKINLADITVTQNPYADAFINQWYSNYLQYAKNNNLINADSNNKIYPAEFVTRGEFAEIIYRLLFIIENPGQTLPPPPPSPTPTPNPQPNQDSNANLASIDKVEVTLIPDSSVLDKNTTVSFGLPLPSGVLTNTDKVAVFDSTGELSSHVKSLGTWQSNPPIDVRCDNLPTPKTGSIRSVLLQFPYTFTKTDPIKITVHLNQNRSKNLINSTAISDTLKLVTSGTYSAEDKIQEPKVYAMLSPNWLACSNLTTMASQSGKLTLLNKFDDGQINFFDTIINNFNPQKQNADELTLYKTEEEPWLYDRAQVFYNGYIRTGQLKFLREAMRATWHYQNLLYKNGECPADIPEQWCKGFFKLKNAPDYYYKDSKYSYAESMATYYWLTGDNSVMERIKDVVSATQTEIPLTDSPPPSYFDERHWAFALLAPVIGYEITGNTAWRQYAQEGIDSLYKMQNSPTEGNPANGCFNSHVEGAGEISFSPWMSSLMAHSLLRAYHTIGDERIPKMLTDLAQCELDRAVYLPTEDGAPNQYMPRYIATSYGTPKSLDGDPWSDNEHAIDVAYVTGLGAYFSKDINQAQKLKDITIKLLATHDYTLDLWTRPTDYPGNGRPLYRVNPPRKYSWWFKNSGTLGWILGKKTELN